MKVLQINSVCGVGSTGRIATDLYKVLEEQGHECVIAYGRGTAPEGIKTIKIGTEAAKYLSEIDAGQTVVCKDSSVVALEGIEGTDKTIQRGGELGGDGCIIVKMARPQQDMRVDIPTVGIETIKKLAEIKAKGIVGEAGKMIFTDQEEAIKLADKHNIFIMGIKP